MKAIGLVFEEEDEEFIMEHLRAIQRERHLAIYPDSPSLPGKPYTIEEYNRILDEAMEGESVTLDEARARFGL
jgi:hypothetical protein